VEKPEIEMVSQIWPEPGLKKKKTLRVIEKLCPECGGDIYVDYKYGRLWKCIGCKRVFPPSRFPLHRKQIKSKEWAAQYHGKYIKFLEILCQVRAVTDSEGMGELMAYSAHPRTFPVYHIPWGHHIVLAKLKDIVIARLAGKLPEAVGVEENQEVIDSWK